MGSMYWSGQDLMSRNAMFNYAIGGRGTGKTYDSKYKRIKHFIKTGKEFIYLRRYKSEFEDKQSFFNDVVERFPAWEFKVEGMKGYMRHLVTDDAKPEKWRVVCYFVTLANALTKKSVPYPNVDWIVFDEFIIPRGALHYLPNEVTAFQDFYNTVDRFQDRVKVMFLANSVSIVNPYFLYYKLKPRKGKQFYLSKDKFHCVEYIQSTNFQQHVDNTRFGQMIRGTDYYNYSVGNEFCDDNDNFISKKPSGAEFHFAIKFDNRVVGIWVDYNTGYYFVSKKYPAHSLIYVLTKSDMEPNLLMIERSSAMMNGVKKLYMLGMVYFDSIETRELFADILNYLNLR